MKNEIQIFNSTEFGSVRMLETDEGKVLFCGADVAKALGYTNSRKDLADYCKEKGVTKCDTLTNGGIQELTYIDEGNLYRLITHSKLPNAERFESWVFDEVLPTIHRTGSYQICKDNSENSLAERKLVLEEMQLRLRMSEHLFSLANVETISENYRTILIAKSAEMLTGEQILMLPKTEQKTYSAGEVGNIFGVSA